MIRKMPINIEVKIKDKNGNILRKFKEDCREVRVEYRKSEITNGCETKYHIHGMDIHIEK